jgi:hypothetical protein
MKVPVLYIHHDTVAGLVFSKEKGGWSLIQAMGSADEVRACALARNGAVVISDRVQFVKSFGLHGEKVASRRAAERFLEQKKLPFSRDDVVWDTCVIADTVNVVSVKKADMQISQNAWKKIGITPSLVTVRASALYNYFRLTTNTGDADFCFICQMSAMMYMLLVDQGRMFFYDIPVADEDEAAREVKRTFEYLQLREKVLPETLEKIYTSIPSEGGCEP